IAGQAAQWDVQEHEDGWHFKKQGKVMVAIAKAAGAASVEIGIEGVDGSWDEFKTRIKANAALSRDGYTTSRGDFIGENDTYGIEQPGDLVDEFPFPRMKVVNSEGNVLVDYRDDKLVMQKDGRRNVLDFSKWQGLEPPPVTRVPDKPQNLSVVEIK
ncbi:hypothetical protein GWO43_05635, partial [candidate division KSB1 bacterium]|nr:hypothetical protein [candidate division KSB1 bacterium]NIR71691.1 hypothetical protein [candidate division KSB1 bacterium]NIS23465.1 hypothetical protein [candidate division KSB1 bacterium]NIT70373.1 hypothetical protein [candidate division KSB1 bacterium]NIU24088.1 hypothetical protein [candidate division KSB1 bacterium]